MGAVFPILCIDQDEEDHDQDPSTMCRSRSNVALQASVEMTGSIAGIGADGSEERQQFEINFVEDLADAAGVDPRRIIITGVSDVAYSGRRRRLEESARAFIVAFQITPATDGTSLPVAQLKSALSTPVSIGGYTAASGLGVVSNTPFECTQIC
eukprot:COSAG02_NODE_19520_length_878_cov_1.038511_1_plen_153_part_10